VKKNRPSTGGTLELSALAIERLWRLTDGTPINSTYVPQADDLEVVYALVRTRLPDVISIHDMTKAFGLHGRHAAYTLEAGSELGLLRPFSKGWFLRSALGERIATLTEAEAYQSFISTVLRLPVIRRVLSVIRSSRARKVSRATVEQLVVAASSGRYTGSTVDRRATTVISWILWLENNVWFAAGV
jgi:hypothetical protein